MITIRPRYDDSWSMYELAYNRTPLGWEDVFEESKDNLKSISDKLDKEIENGYPYYPNKKDIFRSLELIRPENVRVLILGMDPYPGEYDGKPYANGLSFSVNRDVPLLSIPSSLKNIFKELKANIPTTNITSGDLSGWERQGVLLLNASLTGRAGSGTKSGSHGTMWYGFVEKIIDKIKKNGNVVYVLWGKEAEKFSSRIGTKGVKLTSAHPSPLSASKGFIGNKHFEHINKCLTYWNQPPIDFST